jgi:hypothetical protein
VTAAGNSQISLSRCHSSSESSHVSETAAAACLIGFFVARLRKTASVEPLPVPTYKVGKLPFSHLSRKFQANS